MDWLTLLLIAIGAGILAAWLFATQRGSPVEMPGGETILRAAEPSPARRRWRITIERR
jgi:hypothetical protein